MKVSVQLPREFVSTSESLALRTAPTATEARRRAKANAGEEVHLAHGLRGIVAVRVRVARGRAQAVLERPAGRAAAARFGRGARARTHRQPARRVARAVGIGAVEVAVAIVVDAVGAQPRLAGRCRSTRRAGRAQRAPRPRDLAV